MINDNYASKSKKWVTVLRKSIGIAMASAVIVATISMGNVEAKGKKGLCN